MKKIAMVVMLMMGSAILFAQHPGGHKRGPAANADRLKTALTLTDEQYTKVKVINEKFAASHSKLRADTAITVGSLHNRMKALQTEHYAQLKAVLTADQWTKFTALKEKRFEGRKGHGHWHGSGKGG